MKKLKRSLVIWRILNRGLFFLFIASLIPLAILLQAWLDAKTVFAPPALFVVVGLSLIVFTICFYAILRKKSSQYMFRDPCEISLELHEKEKVISLLNEKMHMKAIAQDCWYGKERLRRQLRVFIFYIHDGSPDCLSFADKYVKNT